MDGARQHQNKCAVTGAHEQFGVVRIRFIGTIISTLVIIVIIAFAVHVLWFRDDTNKRLVNDAIDSLDKIQAAVQIGINYKSYRPLLVDARYALNKVDELDIKGDRVTQIHKAFQNYVDAYTLWKHEIDSATPGDCSLALYPKLYKKYKGAYHILPTCKDGVQFAWAAADQHLEKIK